MPKSKTALRILEEQAKAKYETLINRTDKYREEYHCPLLIQVLEKKWRVSAFCKEVLISETQFYRWVNEYPIFKESYHLGQILARENWEEEEDKNLNNPDWDRKTWLCRGSRYFDTDKSKLKLELGKNSTPWEHYQQIMEQAINGEFNASEIKQLMEAVNVGTRVYETFQLQKEIDRMKTELIEMSQRHGNNIVSIVKAENTNQIAI